MSTSSFDTFLTLAETLTKAGWEIIKFENLGGGVKLTLAPAERKQEAE
jgi:hypothetical protein